MKGRIHCAKGKSAGKRLGAATAGGLITARITATFDFAITDPRCNEANEQEKGRMLVPGDQFFVINELPSTKVIRANEIGRTTNKTIAQRKPPTEIRIQRRKRRTTNPRSA